ncbi:toxin glutamine deamidase domain-containing protein [Streptomyces chartreusis]|uniref:toxin glutamine deamidase domain-containing protein n=1 Tax=Streptomyces chartreusis TaxID=1969 RepID=UPI003800B97F
MTTPPPSHADPTAPQNPGSPQATPNDPGNQHHPNQDSLDDIRADLDHYPGGLTEPDPADQQALADAVPRNDDGTPERFPDPHGPWSQLQNDGGNTVPGRSNNCADCSRSFLETWYGNPQVSAPRTVDTDANGNPDYWSPEDNANDNQIRWTGASHTYAGPGGDPNTANNIASVLQQSGPGSAAIVQVDWPGGGGHAFNVVNHDGNIVWIDTQSGDVSDQPLHLDQAEHVWHIPLDANRNPIDLSQPDATNSNQGTDTSQDGTDTTQDGSDTSQEGQDTSQQEPDDNSNQSSDDSKPDPETAQQDPQTVEDGPDTTQQKAADDSADTSHSQNQNENQQTNESDPSTETTNDNPSDNSDATKSESPDTTQSESPDSTKPTDPEPSQAKDQDSADPENAETSQPKDPGPTQSENPDTTQTGNPDSNPPTDPDSSPPADPDSNPPTDPDSSPPTDPDSSPPSTDPDASETKDPDAAESTDPNHTPPEDSADGSPQDPSHPDPLPATATRDTTPPGGVTHPTPAEQQSLENSVPRDENGDPTRPPDPADSPWVRNINGDGADSPGRNNNCTDVALSTVDTYAGNPTAAAARTPDPNPDGTPSDRGEKAGRDRIENTLGARFSDMGNGRGAFNRLENTLRNSGHGSQAVIITQDANGRAHAWNAVNHNGRVTYIDAQTGQQSSKPLHSGNNGVFTIPLDPNRQPVAPEQRSDDGTQPQPKASEATGAPRRAPEAPAGTDPGETEDSWDDEGDNTGDTTGKDPERLGSTPFEEDQKPEHQHYGVAGDQAQRDFREHRDIRQIDLDPVYDTLRDFANNDNAGLRDLLEGSKNGTTWRRDDLADRIPGFNDLSRGQQAAAVGVLARLSNDFHMNQGVGASPYRRDDDQSAYRWSESEETQEAREAHRARDEKRQTNFPGNDAEKFRDSRAAVAAASGKPFSEVDGSNAASASPTQRTRHHLDQAYGESVADQIVDSTKDLKPNFSGRNFAVMEVHDPETGQTHYVADSSFSHAGPRPDHSEPHLGGWIERLNEDRAAKGQEALVPTHLYTEREPCGHPSESKGHADCGGYIRAYLPEEMGTTYATAYRKGEQVAPFSDPREGINNATQAMDADFQDHLNKVADILKAYAMPTPSNPA